MKKSILFVGSMFIVVAVLLAVGCSSSSSTTSPPSGKTIATGAAGNNLTATISNADGSFKKGAQEFTLTFTDASGKPIDVGSAALNLHMPAMGSMAAMNDAATLTTTGTRGVYKGKIDVEMAGEWQAKITYEGPAGKGAFSLPVVAK